MEQLDYNLLYRWFVGLNLDEAAWDTCPSPRICPGGQAIDLRALLRAESRSDDQHAAPSGSTLAVSAAATATSPSRTWPGASSLPCTSGRRPSRSYAGAINYYGSGCPRHGQGGGRPHHRCPRHRAPLAPTPLSRAFGQALREAPSGPPARQRRDQSPRPKNGRRQSAVGCAPNPWAAWRVLHFNVTEHPTTAWTAQQVVDTFSDDSCRPISSAIATGSTVTLSADA